MERKDRTIFKHLPVAQKILSLAIKQTPSDYETGVLR